MSETTSTSAEKSDPAPSEIKRKLRILALHGYRQNAQVFKEKTGSFRKIIHKWAQFTYITAPHKVLGIAAHDLQSEKRMELAIDQNEYGWFFNRDDMTYRGIRKGGPAIGYESSIRAVETVAEKEGPFDGIFAFSQGACFAALLCDLQQRGLVQFTFKFVVIISGFKSDCMAHWKYFKEPIEIPSLHVYGTKDEIIPTEMSEILTELFEEPTIVVHTGGHYVAAGKEQKNQYTEFFKARYEEIVENNNCKEETVSEETD